MYLRMAKRVLLETDKRLLWKLAYNFGFKGCSPSCVSNVG